jgi:predicted GNAT superfamily acetyltransferase
VAGGQADHEAASEAVIEVRRLTTLDEFGEAFEVQRCVWGFAESELVPVALFVVAAEIGGQVLGAFLGAHIVGFCLAFPGIKPDGHIYLHSHMLAVLDLYRNAGVGRLLKLEQRSDALARGIDLVEWTFDPLELKNAYFNIERLGASARRYEENVYGATSSPLHGGLPTDRLVAEWWIAEGDSRPLREIEERIAVPNTIDRVRREDPARAHEIQRTIAERFRACFAKGLAVVGFERNEQEGVYLLGR